MNHALHEDNWTRIWNDRAMAQEAKTMKEIEERFRRDFGPWEISLPPEDVEERRRGKILAAGWAIWYLFGSDERGGYLDYYASHRMTSDRHVRIYEDGGEESLPTVSTMRPASRDPEEDARLAAEHLAENHRVAAMLAGKGFGMEGNEPGGVQINRYLALGRNEHAPEEGGGRP